MAKAPPPPSGVGTSSTGAEPAVTPKLPEPGSISYGNNFDLNSFLSGVAKSPTPLSPFTTQYVSGLLSSRVGQVSPQDVQTLGPTATLGLVSTNLTNEQLQLASQLAGHAVRQNQAEAAYWQNIFKTNPQATDPTYLRWLALPQDMRDAVMTTEFGKDWKAQGHTVNELLDMYRSYPSGYGNMLLGRHVNIPSSVLKEANADPNSTAHKYLEAIQFILPVHREGSMSGYYYKYVGDSTGAKIVEPFSVANQQLEAGKDIAFAVPGAALDYGQYFLDWTANAGVAPGTKIVPPKVTPAHLDSLHRTIADAQKKIQGLQDKLNALPAGGSQPLLKMKASYQGNISDLQGQIKEAQTELSDYARTVREGPPRGAVELTSPKVPTPQSLIMSNIAPANPGNGLAVTAVRSAGLDPNDPNNAFAVSTLSFLGDMIFFGKIGEVGRALKLGSTQLSGLRYALDAQKEAVAAGDWEKAVIAKAQVDGIMNGTPLYDQAGNFLGRGSPITESPLTRALLKFTASSPEELLSSGRGGRLTRDITEAVNNGADASKLVARFPGLSPVLARAFQATAKVRELSQSDVIRLFTNAFHQPADLAATQSSLDSIDSTLAKQAAGRSAPTGPLAEMARGQGILPKRFQLPLADENALLGEKAVLETQLRNVLVASVDSLPKSSTMARVLNNAVVTPMDALVARVLQGHPVHLPVIGKVTTADVAKEDAAARVLRDRADQLYFDALQQDQLAVPPGYTINEPSQALGGTGQTVISNKMYPGIVSSVVEENYASLSPKAKALVDEARSLQPGIDAAEHRSAWLSSRVGQTHIKGERGASPSLARTTQNLYDTRIWRHFDKGAKGMPLDALDQNVQNISRMLNRLEVPRSVRDAVIQQVIDSQNRADFYKMMKSLGEAVKTSPLLDPAEADGFARMLPFRQEAERGIGRVLVDYPNEWGGVSRSSEPILYSTGEDGYTKHWIPSSPGEMLPAFYLPDSRRLVEATGYWRRMLHVAGVRVAAPLGEKQISGVGAAANSLFVRKAAQLYKVGSHAFDGFTRLWKFGIIIPRALFWQFTFRTAGEENLRLLANDYVSYFTHPGEMRRLMKVFQDTNWLVTNDPEEAVGGIGRQLEVEVKSGKRDLYRFTPGEFQDQKPYAIASNYFANRSTDPVWRMFASGDTPESVIKWATKKGGKTAEDWNAQMKDGLSRYKTALEADSGHSWSNADVLDRTVNRMYDEFKQKTQLDQELMDAIRTGHVKPLDQNLRGEIAYYQQRQAELRDEWTRLQRVKLGLKSKEKGHWVETGPGTGYWQKGAEEFQRGYGGAVTQQAQVKLEQAAVNKKLAEAQTELSGWHPAKLGTQDFADWLRDKHTSGWNPEGDFGGTLPSWVGHQVENFRTFNNAAFDKLVQRRDIKYARGPTAAQALERERERLRSLDWKGTALESRAQMNALETTRNMMYDLAQRTSAQTFFRNIFPFGAAWQEILKTWTWDIPAEMFPGIGHISVFGRFHALGQFFHDIGLDTNHILHVPFIGPLVAKMTHSPVKNLTVGFYPSGVSLVTSGFGPGLGFFQQAGLSTLAQHYDTAKYVNNILSPYSPVPNLGSSWLTHVYEAAFGEPPPWEVLSSKIQKMQWQGAVDFATAQEYYLGTDTNGKSFQQTQPDPRKYDMNDPTQKNKFHVAYDAWATRLAAEGEHQAKVYALANLLMSSFSPTNLYISDQTKDMYSTVKTHIGIFPYGDPRRAEVWDAMAKRFPGSQLYDTPESVLAPSAPVVKYQQNDAARFRAYQEQIQAGTRTPYTTKEFIQTGMYLQSYYAHQASLVAIRNQFAGKQGALGLILHYQDYKAAVDQENQGWGAYIAAPDIAAMDNEHTAYLNSLPADAKHADLSINQERELDLLKTFDDLLPELQQGGVTRSDVARFHQIIAKTLDAQNTDFGTSTDPTVRALGSYLDHVSSYYDQTDALYRKADSLERAKRGPIFDQIRKLTDQQGPWKNPVDGRSYPTPEEFAWYAKGPATLDPTQFSPDQKALAERWAMRPTEWLTNFQRSTLGFKESPQTNQFFNIVSTENAKLRAYDKKTSGVGSDTLKQNKADAVQAYLNGEARRLGVEQAWQYSQLAPFIRLQQSGLVDSPQFARAADYVKQTWHYIETVKHEDPAGASADALAAQSRVYSAIDEYRRQSQPFDDVMHQLELDLAPYGDTELAGRDLYSQLFFGQYPFTLMASGHLKVFGG